MWDQHWVLLDHVLWELVGLVGGQALAGYCLLHNLPEWTNLGRGLDLYTQNQDKNLSGIQIFIGKELWSF